MTITAYPPSIGGAQSNIHQLCLRLKEHHQVRVATFWSNNRTDWLMGTTWNAPGGLPYKIDGIDVTPINFSINERASMTPWVIGYYPIQSIAINQLSKYITQKLHQINAKPDIVHHGRVGREPLAFASHGYAKKVGAPFVLTPYHHPRWNGWIYRNFLKLYCQADAVIALTPAEADILEQLGVKRSRIFIIGTGAIIGNNYDPIAFREKYDIDGPMVLFLGQKYKYKGMDQILRAAPIVWSHHPHTKFVFIGPRTTYSEQLFNQIHDPRIIEIEPVSLDEKTSSLAACDLLCLPSSQECFGSVFIEAWKMGKPVIGADIPAISSVISDGLDGYICSCDPSDLANKIVTLLSDPDLRANMGKNGLLKAETQYEWSYLSEQVENVYKTVLGVA